MKYRFRFASRRVAVLCVVSLLAGCASVGPTTDAGPQRRIGQQPPINEIATVTTGSVLFSQFDYTTYRRAVVEQAYKRSIFLSKIQVDIGQPLFPGTVDGRSGWCSANPIFFAIGESRSVCFFDEANTGIMTQAYIVNTLSSILYDVSIPYSVQDIGGSRGFKYDLVYQGFERGIIKISYREYANDIIRPAFQQDLSYTLDKGTTPISFRNIKLEVFEASNNGIRYRILTPFK